MLGLLDLLPELSLSVEVVNLGDVVLELFVRSTEGQNDVLQLDAWCETRHLISVLPVKLGQRILVVLHLVIPDEFEFLEELLLAVVELDGVPNIFLRGEEVHSAVKADELALIYTWSILTLGRDVVADIVVLALLDEVVVLL